MKRKKEKAKTRYYTFRNREGERIELRADLTMEDMVRMGWDDFRFVRPDTPLSSNKWRCEA